MFLSFIDKKVLKNIFVQLVLQNKLIKVYVVFMWNIATASQLVRIIIAVTAIVHLAGFLFIVLFSNDSMQGHELTVQFGLIEGYYRVAFEDSWGAFSQALEDEQFNSVLILGGGELIPFIFIYWNTFRLFTLYRQGEIFSAKNIHCLRNIGSTLLAWIVFNLLYPVLVTLVIRLTGASDSLAIYVSLSSQEGFYLLCGTVIFVMAWVMKEGLRLKEEQELVI